MIRALAFGVDHAGAAQALLARDRDVDSERMQRGIRVPVAGDQSAVDALRAVGIDIPVSCEQGLCGTCVVGAEGEGAEHRDVCLTRSERAHKVALCCSRAKGEDLVVDL